MWERIRERREHRWSWPRISEYIDGGLAPAEQWRLRRHVEICQECAPLLRSLLWLVGALRALAGPPEPTVVPGVLEQLRAEGFHSAGDDGHLA
jgi:anti-sigma factor RsiW